MVLRYIVLFTAGFGIAMMIYWSMKKASESQKWLLLTAFGATVCELLYYLEISYAYLEVMTFVHNLSYMTKAFTLMNFWMFIYGYCDIKLKKSSTWIAYGGMLLLTVVLTLNSIHGLFYEVIGIGTDYYVPYLILEYGILYYVFLYGMWGFMIFCAVAIVRRVPESRGLQRKRYMILAATMLFPTVGMLLEILPTGTQIDFINMDFAVGLVLLYILTRKYGLLDTMQVAKESIMDNTKEGLLVVDTEYNVLYANNTVMDKYPEIMDLKTEQGKAELKKLFEQPEKVYKNGNVYCEIRVSELLEGTILRGYMAWILDMSFVNEYTNEILHLKDRAERANKEKTEYIAKMSKEIRTSIDEILAFSEQILEQEGNPASTQEYAYDLRGTAKKLRKLTKAGTSFSEQDMGKKSITRERYYTQSMLENISSVIQNQTKEKGLTFKVTVDPKLPYRLRGASGSIQEVLMNVLNNAVKYTDQGTISLDVCCKWKTEKHVQLEMVVTDTGIGMQEEDVETIFDKFSQADAKGIRKAKGNGFGMAIAKSLVEQMDGQIQVESTYGEGTKVTICLQQEIADERPIGDISLSLMQSVDEEFRQAFITTAKVLLIDSNEASQQAMTELFQNYGISADIVENGDTALEAIQKQQYDLIFMDQKLSGTDGVEMMLRIRELDKGKYQQLPIIALAEKTASKAREDLRMLGFDGHLLKPVADVKLEKMMRELLPKTKISYINTAYAKQRDADKES